MNKDPQADVRTFVKVFAFDKIRTDLNTVGTPWSLLVRGARSRLALLVLLVLTSWGWEPPLPGRIASEQAGRAGGRSGGRTDESTTSELANGMDKNDGRTDGRTDRRADGRMGGRTDGHGRTDGRTSEMGEVWRRKPLDARHGLDRCHRRVLGGSRSAWATHPASILAPSYPLHPPRPFTLPPPTIV